MRKFIDLTGQRFGRLTVFKRQENDKFGQTRWLCLCECGNKTIVLGGNLRSGHIKSCGCLQKENRLKHGHNIKGKISKTYTTWHGIIQRCTDPNHKSYQYYGGRIPPITVCDRWNPKRGGGFKNFLEDVDEIPEELTLDRINNEKGYSPDNYRLSTRKEQNRNYRRNITIPYNDKDICLKDYCKIKNLNYNSILSRIWNGMSVEDAITIPIRKHKKHNRRVNK